MKIALEDSIIFTFDDSWQRIESIPEDPPNSQAYAKETDNSHGLLLVLPIATDKTMPFGDPGFVIDSIHGFLGDNEALIEVESKTNEDASIIYSIVKTLMEPRAVQYIYTADIKTKNRPFRMQGCFEEAGTTGLRDAYVYELNAGTERLRFMKSSGVMEPPSWRSKVGSKILTTTNTKKIT